jgi:hypothetical protein
MDGIDSLSMVKALGSHHLLMLSLSNPQSFRSWVDYTIIKPIMILHIKIILFLQLVFGIVLSHQYLVFIYAIVLIDSYNY